ncbi:MAG: thioredoxin family protein [Fibrobacter sp.]|nr:thioredoxin family protein [Fibrobacter sp.]
MKCLKFKSFVGAVAMVAAMGAFTNVIAAPAKAPKAAAQDEVIKIVRVDDSNFEKEILYSDKPTILDVFSSSCPPCLIMIPTLIDIAKKYPDVKVASVGFDEPNVQKIKNTLPIQAFPTFFLIKDGRIVNRIQGAASEEQLLAALQYTPKAQPTAKPAKAKKTGTQKLTCSTNGQFGGIQNHVTMSLVITDDHIDNVDLVTDVFVTPEMESRRAQLKQMFLQSGKGTVEETMTGFRLHTANESPFIKAMNMQRKSSYAEMKAGLELQGFKCK